MIYAGILAGGITLYQNIPIQFSMLGDKPIIIHTLEQFLICNSVEKIVVAAPEEWSVYTKDIIKKWLPQNIEVNVIIGGGNKNLSIIRITEYIDKNWGIGEDDILICHDAVRPFVSQRIINENIDISEKYGAANTAILTVDTIIMSENGKTITEMPERMFMYAEQTPQTFRIKAIKEVLNSVGKEEHEKTIDTAKLFYMAGNKVHIVKGDYSNIKIINPYDVEVANALIKEKK